jgi:hypothetical protein
VSEIPEDIDKIATDIVRNPLEGEEDFELYLRVARAIATERERCAKIAEEKFTPKTVNLKPRGDPYKSSEVAIWCSKQIAAAIRSPK